VEALWQDIRLGVRMLARQPAFTIVIVLTLGLGIGANTAVFNVVNALLLRPMPVVNPEQITVLTSVQHPGGEQPSGISYLDYLRDVRIR
jgi:putative ABC transport system permease protein